MKNGGILGKATLVPTVTPPASVANPTTAPSPAMTELTNIMDRQQVMLDRNREETVSGGSVAMVNAPSTTNVSNNTTQYQGGSIVVSNPMDNTVSNYRR
jgi:hypothetical protein